eukprot:6181084-Pleurochrysis_carterae.AAC.1
MAKNADKKTGGSKHAVTGQVAQEPAVVVERAWLVGDLGGELCRPVGRPCPRAATWDPWNTGSRTCEHASGDEQGCCCST